MIDRLVPAEPLPLFHSWPVAERDARFEQGVPIATRPYGGAWGQWSCNLSDQTLTWDEAVFDLFGLPRDAAIGRAEALACYREESRAAMERLRAHAIRHRRGFTLDVAIAPANDLAATRWVRLTAAPTGAPRPFRLEGIKADVTALYRR